MPSPPHPSLGDTTRRRLCPSHLESWGLGGEFAQAKKTRGQGERGGCDWLCRAELVGTWDEGMGSCEVYWAPENSDQN